MKLDLSKLKATAKRIPWWGWALIAGGGVLFLGGESAVVYMGWNEAQVRGWIDQAIATLNDAGIDTSAINPDDLVIIAKGESNGNPNAVQQIHDINSDRGDPAKGLMQTIAATFNSYALPGHTNIFNPVDNLIASIRYILHRYHASSNVPGVVAVNNGSSYVGY